MAALFFAFGLSLDGILECYSNKRQQEIKAIGRSALRLGGAMRQNRIRPEDDEALVQQFAPRIESVLYALKRIGIPMLPIPEENLRAFALACLIEYLRSVGQLLVLEDGQFDEARECANYFAAQLAEAAQYDLPDDYEARTLA